jgi:hypothetical protein
VSSSDASTPGTFRWLFQDTRVEVHWQGASWSVSLYGHSRLGGPNSLISRKDYADPRHAAIAVMTHVRRITTSADEGVRQGKLAGRWIREHERDRVV